MHLDPVPPEGLGGRPAGPLLHMLMLESEDLRTLPGL